eukprot:357948-Chlamydomonas_euryale.AAC.1
MHTKGACVTCVVTRVARGAAACDCSCTGAKRTKRLWEAPGKLREAFQGAQESCIRLQMDPKRSRSIQQALGSSVKVQTACGPLGRCRTLQEAQQDRASWEAPSAKLVGLWEVLESSGKLQGRPNRLLALKASGRTNEPWEAMQKALEATGSAARSGAVVDECHALLLRKVEPVIQAARACMTDSSRCHTKLSCLRVNSHPGSSSPSGCPAHLGLRLWRAPLVKKRVALALCRPAGGGGARQKGGH